PATDYETFIGRAGPVEVNGTLSGATVTGHAPGRSGVNLGRHLRTQREVRKQIVLRPARAPRPVYAKFSRRRNIKLVEDPPGPLVRATPAWEIHGLDMTPRAASRRCAPATRVPWDSADIDDPVGEDQIEYRDGRQVKRRLRLASILRRSLWSCATASPVFDIGGTIHAASERNLVLIHIRMPERFRIARATSTACSSPAARAGRCCGRLHRITRRSLTA
ncbi:MAG: hypothetical protein IPK65_14545, partial [Gammaproteobacteria bacterium]|nr:hypothetical protein [Gammaproteobacteria bacterium]